MQLPSPNSLRTRLPVNPQTFSSIEKHRKEISDLINGTDMRFAIVTGPCSLHDLDSALIYANKLFLLQKHVEKTCKLVMRAHVEKPRTLLGWKGVLHDPSLEGKNDMIQGIPFSRNILMQLANTGIALASEFLDPIASSYFADLISWGFIGARTSTSQIHRQLASSLPMPVGFKNSLDGDIQSALYGAVSAKQSHSLLQIDEEGKACSVRSAGNPFAHIVLRGAANHTNYKESDIQSVLDLCQRHDLSHRILVDCAHGNSLKKLEGQESAFLSILEQYLSGNQDLLGVMLESHLEEGSQSPSSSARPSVSITDPCIGWEQTEELILSVHESLSTVSCS